MSDSDDTLWNGLQLGHEYQVQLSNGSWVQGRLCARHADWLELQQEAGHYAVARSAIALLILAGRFDAPPAKAPARPRVAGRGPAEKSPVPDADILRRVCSGILDGIEGPELRAMSGLGAGELARLRQAFECARGNLMSEDIPPAARAWVEPIRRALGG
ncbi:MAG: hypothetical protein EA402_13790 [Planctomycetota bacterium]|nr:MAG: hypothetical protein EA402_13790 [Planctomycetota bacterium]